MAAERKVVVLEFPAPPHRGQQRVLDSFRDNLVTVATFGRRWGKSSVRPYAINQMMRTRTGWVEGACAFQSHAEAERSWEADGISMAGAIFKSKNADQNRYHDFKPMLREIPGLPVIQNEGGRVYYPSFQPGSARGFQGHGLHFFIGDELSHWNVLEGWYETAEPMLSDTGGHALLIGTPIPEGPGFAEFADLAERCSPDSQFYNPRWSRFTGPSEENPFIKHDEIAAKRAYLTATGRGAMARCLYDGEFVTDFGAVFTNIDAVFCLRAKEIDTELWLYRLAHPSEPVIVSIDFGRHDDSTVIMAFSRHTLEMLAVQRIQRTEYLVQLPIIDRFIRRFPHAQIWAEGKEEAAAELLRMRYGEACNLVKWSAGGKFDKATSVARGMDYFERGAWTFIDLPWMKEEFVKFTRKKSPSGRWQYEASEGKHDDSVAAACYATYGLPLIPEVVRVQPIRQPVDPLKWYKRLDAEESPLDGQPFVLRRLH